MEYPRPQLRREKWTSLDGQWRLYFDDRCEFRHPVDVPFDRVIEVPYAPEAQLSGIGDTTFHPRVWYRRHVNLSSRRPGDRQVLHFGAVDYHARVYVDGHFVGEHEGGHVPFHFDITDFLTGDQFEIALVADDDPKDLHKPRGKQDWQPEPHNIWYPRTTGIWRSVWLESVAATHLAAIEWRPDVPQWRIGARFKIIGHTQDLRLRMVLRINDTTIASDEFTVLGNMVERVIVLPDGGIDDAREAWMWSPEHPQLIDAELILLDTAGVEIDRVQSYTALRTVAADGNRFMLNSRPYALRMVLDQGYWADGLMTASSEKLREDVELIKRLGFNGARKHQKIEDPRWLYWCDVLGLAVWVELPAPYAFSSETVVRMHQEWREVVERDVSHPCVIAWVPVNESWGVPELPNSPRQRALVRSLVEVTHALDGTRPVVGNDGWEIVGGDLVNIHDYHVDPKVLVQRYGSAEALSNTLTNERPIRRRIALEGFDPTNKPVLLTEFGGIAFIADSDGWGYSVATSSEELIERYEALLEAVHRCTPLAGFCYTQLTDTALEKNGLLTEDRRPKADIERLAGITRGKDNGPLRQVHANAFGYSGRWLKTLEQRKGR